MPPGPDRPALTRRAALLAAGGVAVGACSPYESRREPRSDRLSPLPKPQPGIDPDVLLAADVLAAEQALLQRVEDTIVAFPRLSRPLAAVRRVHIAHVELLEKATPPKGSPKASPPPAPEDSLSPSPSGAAPVPRDADRAVRELVRAEEELSTSEKRSAFAAESGVFARVLASMAAAAAQQATLVGAGGRS